MTHDASPTPPPSFRAWRAAVALALLAGSTLAHAFGVSQFSPQGEVARVRQVVARFDAPAIRFGDPAAPAPLEVRCDNAAASAGQGRWNSDREWVYEFNADLPPGVRCTATPVSGFQSASGQPLTGAGSYQFHTGGPFVQSVRPSPGQPIEEEQTFLLRLNGPATPQSVQASMWCVADGVGERIPVRLIEGEARTALLKALLPEKEVAAQPQRFLTLACNRRLTAGGRVQLVFGKGVATPSGVANQVEKRFAFQVREPFTAELSCERENAQAACMPIRPVTLHFSAPVPRKQLEAARLRGDKTEYPPVFDADLGADALVDSLRFPAPLPERASFSVSLPEGLKDASGRTLANAASFPLKVATGPMPPLAKFASGSFGIIERFAEGPDGPALLPLTLRYLEPALQTRQLTVSDLAPQRDAEIIRWFTRVQRLDGFLIPREDAARLLPGVALPKPVGDDDKDMVQPRMLSLLAGQSGARALQVPPAAKADQPRPFEVIGVPLAPGFHVVELASPVLGRSLLDARYGAGRTMYVRTTALVTNLAVHFKLGRENALAWVTSLDKGQPVAGAAVRVSDCKGREVAAGSTDAQGIARFEGIDPQPPDCGDANEENGPAYFVSARASNEGAADMAFTWSSWQKGIEAWRFNVPTSREARPDLVAHTVFDRTLLRAGDTVSMKHLLRAQTGAGGPGFALPKVFPAQLVIQHVGSGQEYTMPLNWRATATGGRSSESQFAIPRAAKLGVYRVLMRMPPGKNGNAGGDDDAGGQELESGSFRVEEFRLPVLQGSVAPESKEALVAPASVPVQLQVGYVSGGPAASLPVRVSATVRGITPDFPDYGGFSFDAPRGKTTAQGNGEEDEPSSADTMRVVADKLPATLSREGTGRVVIDKLVAPARPEQLLIEASYADPNGEIQTVQHSSTLWPAAVVAGIQAERWVSVDRALKLQALALDLHGKPLAGMPLDVKALARITTTTRKRMVGGFYTYDSHTTVKDLGTVCTGKSDARGLLACTARLTQPGEIELVAIAHDAGARQSQAAATVWVTRQGELWFGGENDDRMDVLPEKRSYRAGETARFQVRMPFRRATALVAVEREGIVSTRVVELRGDDPTVELPVQAGWSPNVYVSVLALRGRLHEVPWYSFFTWGYRSPREWWQAFWSDSKDFIPPTALVDLSKPAFRLGMAEIRVDDASHRLDVKVTTDHPSYPVRGKARVTISARLPDGQPAAHAEVALAAVDQALLELMPNTSWQLLQAMLQRRAWGVETATAQMEIVGRRHYGRKAVPAGGDGGGKAPTRELLDTLLLWNPRVELDAQGQASLDVPLNDSLTSFRIVAVADSGTGLFGTGEATIAATQDLQLISGLPPLVREGDRFRAMITARNTTKQAMKVTLTPRATLLTPQPQTVDIPPGEARELAWDLTAPTTSAQARTEALVWEIAARDGLSGAQDALRVTQRLLPAVPLTVQQAALVQLDGSTTLDVAPPTTALSSDGAPRGGISLAATPRLADGLPGVADWFRRYPYNCLEQQTSRALALRDDKAWAQLTAQIPAYLDGDGLAYYFPPAAGTADSGSDTLTAYLLAATSEAARLDPALTLPDAVRAPMLAGLAKFVEGKLERKHWSPRDDLDVRKLAAIEALSRYGAARPGMLAGITVAPNQWPTSALLDWIGALQRMQGVPDQARLLAEARQILRARLTWQGTRVGLSTEGSDGWWWLMAGTDANLARTLLLALPDPAWKDDLGRLASGFIARQQGGAWHTTVANLWGSLALERFSREREAAPVTGLTEATLGDARAAIDWRQVRRAAPADAQGAPSARRAATAVGGPLTGNTAFLPWPAHAGAPLTVTQQGSGKPWLTVQSLAAVPVTAPFSAGYQIKKTVAPVDPAEKTAPAGPYRRGDILRVTLEITATSDMTWVAVTDPIPGGATILGSGLGRDSQIATQGERRSGPGWPVYEERSFEAFRGYYERLPKGTTTLAYTLRLNNPGTFQLPATRVEALYAPEIFGVAPNAPVTVQSP